MKLITVSIVYLCTFLNNVVSGEFNLVKTLIENGADVNTKNNENLTPLHLSSSNGNVEIARLLIEHGAYVDATTNQGLTPLHLASRNNNGNIQLSFNITDGQAWFDTNSDTCDSPVNGEPNLCDTYVLIKIDGEQVYRTKEIDNVEYLNFNEIFQTGWISRDAIITFEMWDSDVGYSPEDLMSTWSGNADYYLSRHLLEGNITDSLHRNSLSVSTELVNRGKSEDRIAVAKLLLEYRADVNLKDNDKDSPLHLAVQSRNEKLIELLLQYGAKRYTENRDEITSQDMARQSGNTKIIDLFEKAKLKNIQNACKYNAMDYIHNGELTKEGEFPWMAALGYVNERHYRVSFDCGGTIISNLFVLTAAHCVKARQPSIVRMGKISLIDADDEDEFSTVNRHIEEIISHPSHSPFTKRHDIALLRLKRVIPFSDYVKPACLQTDMRDEPPNVPLIVTGWGIISGHTRSNDLRKAQLMTMPLAHCNTTLTNWGKPRKDSASRDGLIDGQYCAYDPQGRNDSCKGDSGGPLQYFPTKDSTVATVLGIVSFGVGCGSRLPSVYTRVSYYLDWIEPIVWSDL